jgi:hypothetical protein
MKLLSAKYSDTSAKLQDLSAVLHDGTLLAELYCLTDTTYMNMSLVNSEMRDMAGFDAANLAKNWGIGIEAANGTRLVTTQRGIRRMIHPIVIKRYKTNDRQLCIFAFLSQCLLPQFTQKSFKDNKTRQLKYYALILDL